MSNNFMFLQLNIKNYFCFLFKKIGRNNEEELIKTAFFYLKMTKMTEYRADIYIILVNYGSWEDTDECINSIDSYSTQKVNVIIIDILNLNNSMLKLTESINQLSFNNYRIVEQKQNNGFASACNIGIKYVLNENPDCFIWILNNDTIITKNSLAYLLECYYQNKEKQHIRIGFIGSVIIDYFNRDKIQFAGGKFDLKWASFKVTGEGDSLNELKMPKCEKTDWLIGASIFFQSKILKDIGLMPENYFLYYEDIDWSLQAIKKGYSNLISSESIIIHKQGSTTNLDYNNGKRFNFITARYFYSSYLKFFRLNYPQKLMIAYIMVIKQMLGQFVKLQFKRSYVIFQVLTNQLIKRIVSKLKFPKNYKKKHL